MLTPHTISMGRFIHVLDCNIPPNKGIVSREYPELGMQPTPLFFCGSFFFIISPHTNIDNPGAGCCFEEQLSVTALQDQKSRLLPSIGQVIIIALVPFLIQYFCYVPILKNSYALVISSTKPASVGKFRFK